MKTNIGLHDEARLEIGQMLNLLLADEYVHYAITRDYHWNVTGPEFLSLHPQFESHYVQIADWIDDIAERARAIGTGAPGQLDRIDQGRPRLRRSRHRPRAPADARRITRTLRGVDRANAHRQRRLR